MPVSFPTMSDYDALSERLSASTELTRAAIVTLRQDVDALRAGVTPVSNEKIEALRTELNTLSIRVAEIEGTTPGESPDLTDLNKALTQIHEMIATIVARLTKLEIVAPPPPPPPPGGGTGGGVPPVELPGDKIVTVGVGKMFPRIDLALKAIGDRPGYTLVIDPGRYENDGGNIYRDMDLRCSDPKGWVHIDYTIMPKNGKAAFTIWNADRSLPTVVSFRRFRFSNIVVGDRNGCGIRPENPSVVTVEECWFERCDQGILFTTGLKPTIGKLALRRCWFDRMTQADGFAHSVYVNYIQRVEAVDNLFTGNKAGHHLKVRSKELVAYNNRFHDLDGGTSYNIDCCSGGIVDIAGNDFVQGPGSDNPCFVGWGTEGTPYEGSIATIRGNRFANQFAESIIVLAKPTGVPVLLVNNEIHNVKDFSQPNAVTQIGNSVPDAPFEFNFTPPWDLPSSAPPAPIAYDTEHTIDVDIADLKANVTCRFSLAGAPLPSGAIVEFGAPGRQLKAGQAYKFPTTGRAIVLASIAVPGEPTRYVSREFTVAAAPIPVALYKLIVDRTPIRAGEPVTFSLVTKTDGASPPAGSNWLTYFSDDTRANGGAVKIFPEDGLFRAKAVCQHQNGEVHEAVLDILVEPAGA